MVLLLSISLLLLLSFNLLILTFLFLKMYMEQFSFKLVSCFISCTILILRITKEFFYAKKLIEANLTQRTRLERNRASVPIVAGLGERITRKSHRVSSQWHVQSILGKVFSLKARWQCVYFAEELATAASTRGWLPWKLFCVSRRIDAPRVASTIVLVRVVRRYG